MNTRLTPQVQRKHIPDLGSAEPKEALLLSCPSYRQMEQISLTCIIWVEIMQVLRMHVAFFYEFSMLLERLVSSLGNLLFKNGDFNFHVNDPSDSTTSQFLDLLNSFYLDIFNLCTPTHKNNNVIITWSGETSVSNLSVHNPVISDHFAVHCSLAVKKPPNAKLTVMTRKLCNIDSDSLLTDIHSSSL